MWTSSVTNITYKFNGERCYKKVRKQIYYNLIRMQVLHPFTDKKICDELLEKVEGCSHVTDVPTRYVLHDGDLVEMDISENTALHRVHGYLMNDGFMVATWLPNRRGPVRYVMINEILLRKIIITMIIL